jgi:hypothetical protein
MAKTMVLAAVISMQYRHVGALGIPIVLALVTIIAKKLARRERGFIRNDFYLGVDLTVASLSILLANVYDLFDPQQFGAGIRSPLLLNGAGAAIASVFLLFVVSLHQDYESKGSVKFPNESFWVGFLANMIGFGLLFSSAVFMPIGR